MNSIKLYKGNCLDVMKNITDKSVDMVLCDLPYGTSSCRWDVVLPFELLWEQYNRIVKDNGAIVLFGSEPFSSTLRMSNIKNYKYDWIWHKHSAANIFNAKYQPLKTIENVMIFSNGGRCNYYPILTTSDRDRSQDKSTAQKTDIFSNVKSGEFKRSKNIGGKQRYPKCILDFSNANHKNLLHPTQKPVQLLSYLISTYTPEINEDGSIPIVLDNCMGSGSTGVACINTKRNFIGIEKDEKYFEIATERIKAISDEIIINIS